MERPQRATIAGIFLIILHGVGLIGFSMPEWVPLFQTLTPLNLLITNVLLGVFHKVWNQRFAIWAVMIFLAGYFVELAGVETGIIFGEYAYLDVLGPKIFGVPPLIGLNWLMLVYISGVLCNNIGGSIWRRAALGASLMTALDFMMEPVAIRLEFWTWFDQTPPLQNFIAWWVIAYILLLGFYKLPQSPRNPLAVWVLAAQLLFFGGLWLLG